VDTFVFLHCGYLLQYFSPHVSVFHRCQDASDPGSTAWTAKPLTVVHCPRQLFTPLIISEKYDDDK